jgi:hypothetical protein
MKKERGYNNNNEYRNDYQDQNPNCIHVINLCLKIPK